MTTLAKVLKQVRANELKSDPEDEIKHLTTDQKLDLILSRLDEFDDRLNRIEDQLGHTVTRLDTLAADVMGKRAKQGVSSKAATMRAIIAGYRQQSKGAGDNK